MTRRPPPGAPLRACALVLAAGLALSACSSSAPTPEPWTGTADDETKEPPTADAAFTGTLEFQTGSVPPPYHYELTLELTADEYTFSWSGYDDEVGRATGAPLDPDAALEILDASGLLEGDDDDTDCVGGPQAQLDVEVDGEDIRTEGATCGDDGSAREVKEAIVAIVGEDVVTAAIDEVAAAG